MFARVSMVAWDRTHRYEMWQLTEHHKPLTFANMIFHRSCTVTHPLVPYHKCIMFQLDPAADYCSEAWHCKAGNQDASSFENVLKEELSGVFVSYSSLYVQHGFALLCYQRNSALPYLSNYIVPGSVYIMPVTHGAHKWHYKWRRCGDIC